jgi:hypothetical protein
MADVFFENEIEIIVKAEDIYPSDALFPSDDLLPSGEVELTNIVEGSMVLSRMLCSNGLKFGEACSNMFEVDLYETSILAKPNLEIVVNWKVDAHTVPLFTGKIDECKKVSRLANEIHLVAYDNLYFEGERDATEWWNSRINASTYVYVEDVFVELLEEMGLELYETIETYKSMHSIFKDFMNFKIYKPIKVVETWSDTDDYHRTKTELEVESVTFRSLLSMFCELMCCIPNIAPNGKLALYFLNGSSLEYCAEIYEDEIEDENSDTLGYVTERIDGISFIGMGGTGTINYSFDVGQTPKNSYVVKENALLSSLSSLEFSADISRQNQFVGMFQSMKAVMDGLVYSPLNINMIVSNFNRLSSKTTLGVPIIWDGNKSFVLQETFTGPMLVNQEFVAGGEQKQTSQSVYSAKYKEKTA